MNRIAGLLFLGAAAAAALFLFVLKYEVQALEDELARVQGDVLRHQEALHILEAEWSYLNQPARIADLTSRHLELQPLPADRFVMLDEIPERPEGEPHVRPLNTPTLTSTAASVQSGTPQ
jgi:hypothetical protein